MNYKQSAKTDYCFNSPISFLVYCLSPLWELVVPKAWPIFPIYHSTWDHKLRAETSSLTISCLSVVWYACAGSCHCDRRAQSRLALYWGAAAGRGTVTDKLSAKDDLHLARGRWPASGGAAVVLVVHSHRDTVCLHWAGPQWCWFQCCCVSYILVPVHDRDWCGETSWHTCRQVSSVRDNLYTAKLIWDHV